MDVNGYEKAITDFNVINTHIPEKTAVSFNKVWNDDENRDGIRPEEITVILVKDGKDTSISKTVSGPNFSGTFDNLDKYRNEGTEIIYSIKEAEVEGYTTEIAPGQETNYIITNTHIPERIELTGKKTWDDADNQDGIRPEEITVTLYGNGEVINEQVANKENSYEYQFANLLKYENGVEIEYTVDELEIPAGYEKTVEGMNIINHHIPEVISIPVKKIWADDENRDGIRPEKITLNLIADGEIINAVEVTAETEWKTIFENLPKYKAEGQEIVYTVTEENIEGYTTTYQNEDNRLIITNTHEPELIKIEGTKTWDDLNNKDKLRPETITIILLANGSELNRVEVTSDEDGTWAYEFTDLFKYENGKEIVYTINEEKVDGYEAIIDGFNITNKHVASVDLLVKVHKVSAGTKLPLMGAEVTLFNEDGTIAKDVNGKDCIKTTDKNGDVEFTLNCEPGTKFYAQETKAPGGYHINPNKFEVIARADEDNILNIDIELIDNAVILPPTPGNNAPITGDSSQTWLYTTVLITSITLALVLGLRKKLNR